MDLSKVFNAIEMNAAKSIKANEGDYIIDGLLHCGKCNTPKQCRVELFGIVKTPYCLCKCEAERRDAEEEELRRYELKLQMEKMRYQSFTDADMRNWTFANDDQANTKISAIARNYVENFATMKENGKGLLLFGAVGTGKTYISACIANALIDKGVTCLVTNFARLVNTIGGMYGERQEYIDGLNRFDLLVIDDLASERDTEYMNEYVQNIIDSRYRARLPIIITTNLTSEELKHPRQIEKQRVYSRLFQMCIPIQVEGADRRKQTLISDYKEFADLLGL